MRNKDTFSTYHPLVNFLYFALVLVFAMCLMHPISLGISLASSLIYGYNLNGSKTFKFALMFLLPMMLLTAVINPAFNHQGNTILLYLPTGNPLTLESIAYGISASCMLAAVMQWFSCYSAVMTSDKFVYLFGKIIPALSLVLSMTLRFVPKFKAQAGVVQESQKAIGRDASQGSIFHRMKMGITVLSILVTWSLENAIETADGMKSRGYGLPNRTAFSIYFFQERDKMMLIWLFFCGFYLISGWVVGTLNFQYYPIMVGADLTPFTLTFQGVYLALCLTPTILNRQEERTWNRILAK